MLWRVRFDCQSLLRGHWLRPAALRPQQRLVRECRRGGRGAKVQGECLGRPGTSFPPHTSWRPSSNCLLAQQPSGPAGLGCAHPARAGPVWLRPSTVPLPGPAPSSLQPAGLLCMPCTLVSLVGWMGSGFPNSSRRSQQSCLGSQPAVWHELCSQGPPRPAHHPDLRVFQGSALQGPAKRLVSPFPRS